jgi:predicted flap endonuclease-1-like 5' DNA nuclease
MFWLVWQMGVLLLIAFGAGVFVGYLVWSGDARSAEADKALSDNARLRQENENLARRLGEAAVKPAVPASTAAQAEVSPANPVTPEPEEASAPAAKAAPASSAATSTGEDDLTRIKGLGPKAEAALKAGGVTRIAQIAQWSGSDIEMWDDCINGRGRIVRDDWVGQAREMASASGQ